MLFKKRRWSDNDKYFGPFTYSRDRKEYRPFSVMLDSGEEDYPGCSLRLRGLGHTLIVALPPVVPIYREKVEAKHWDAATIERMGRSWYWDEFPREFGFSLDGGSIHLRWGRQTHASDTTKSKVVFLPWMEWRHVRRSWYGPNCQHIETLWDTTDREVRRAQWDWVQEFEDSLVKTEFAFTDYDNEVIMAQTNIEEREWRRGTGCFKWLSWFCKPRVRRYLEIKFSSEVGRRKGSWKGGTIGHSIDMHPDEDHERAFRRYCDENELKFQGLTGFKV